MLGIISASFLIGVGLFQVPAGIIAAKYGLRNMAIYGIMIASTAALVTGLASGTTQITILRFLIGIGMACFFGPSVMLVSRYLGKESEGLGIGLLNSAHALGGIVGLFGWVVLAEALGWRASLILSGGLGIATALMLSRALIKEEVKVSEDFRIKISDILKTIFNKSLIILGFTLLGFQAGSSMILTFSVFYFVDHLNIHPVDAGLIASLSLVVALVSSPLFGRIYDKIGNAKKLAIYIRYRKRYQHSRFCHRLTIHNHNFSRDSGIMLISRFCNRIRESQRNQQISISISDSCCKLCKWSLIIWGFLDSRTIFNRCESSGL